MIDANSFWKIAEVKQYIEEAKYDKVLEQNPGHEWNSKNSERPLSKDSLDLYLPKTTTICYYAYLS